LIPQIVQSMNSRLVKVHGYTPDQLLFGFNPRYEDTDGKFDDEIRMSQVTEEQISKVMPQDAEMEEIAYEERLSRLDKLRAMAANRAISQQSIRADKSEKDGRLPEKDDLVLLRRLGQDNQHGHKVEP
jgi:hypothetical protein